MEEEAEDLRCGIPEWPAFVDWGHTCPKEVGEEARRFNVVHWSALQHHSSTPLPLATGFIWSHSYGRRIGHHLFTNFLSSELHEEAAGRTFAGW